MNQLGESELIQAVEQRTHPFSLSIDKERPLDSASIRGISVGYSKSGPYHSCCFGAVLIEKYFPC